MKTHIRFIPFLLLLFTASCGNYVYRATALRVPLVKEQHDVDIQLNSSTAGTEIYAAYAPLDNIAISAGYAGSKDTNFDRNSRFSDLEFSVMPFYAKNMLRLEMPLGFGYTRRESLDNSFATFQPYTRYFIQPTVAMGWEYIDLALIFRSTFIEYTNPAFKQDIRNQLGIMFRAGIPTVKAMAQFSTEFGTQNTDLVDYYPIHVAVGLNFYFNAADPLRKKSKTAPNSGDAAPVVP
jgi:hypothetical protein